MRPSVVLEKNRRATREATKCFNAANARIMSHHPDFPVDHPQIPWSKIKGMRNIVMHDYFEIELPVIWKTVRDGLPRLIADLDALCNWRAQGE